MTENDPIPFAELVHIADQILEKGEDEPDLLARELERLPPAIRNELLTSDLLNAFQVFYYVFRIDLGDIERDRLILQPGSAILSGVMVTRTDLYELVFSLEMGGPVCSVSDGKEVIARFHGRSAYGEALRFLAESG